MLQIISTASFKMNFFIACFFLLLSNVICQENQEKSDNIAGIADVIVQKCCHLYDNKTELTQCVKTESTNPIILTFVRVKCSMKVLLAARNPVF